MSQVSRHQIVIPSLLDRLTDEEPDKLRESVKSRYQQLLELRDSVRRDIENLLNTRRPVLSWPSEWKELEKSLMAYGAPDVIGRLLDTAELQNDFCQELQNTLQYFEPRLKGVSVKLLSNQQQNDQTLRLRIEALLAVEPAPEPIVLDSILIPGEDNFTVIESEAI